MDKEEIRCYKKAGEIASESVRYAKSFINPGMILLEIAEKIESKIKELGGEVAFPVNLSVNEIAAHYTPSPEDATKAEGLLSVDIGVAVSGFIADTAFSLDLTPDKRFEEMINLNKEVLNEVLKKAENGMKVMDVGEIIQSKLEDYNKKNSTKFSIIKNLTGHSLGENMIHSGLTIPNFRNNNSGVLEGAIAIEPFLTTGQGEVYESSPSEIFMLQRSGSVRDAEARKILNFIAENYKTRPFCRRWIESAGFKKVNFTLSLLVRQGILHNFPVLIERSKAPVSQEEHTILFNENLEVITR